MADFIKFYPLLAVCEGGLSDSPYDKGGFTNMGITWGTFQNAVLAGVINYPLTKEGLAKISPEDVRKIAKLWYWDAMRCDDIKDQKIANSLADACFNCGANGSSVLMQKSLNSLGHNLVVDGIIGAKSLKAINETDAKVLLLKFNFMRSEFYKGIVSADKSQLPNLRGWLNRVQKYA